MIKKIAKIIPKDTDILERSFSHESCCGSQSGFTETLRSLSILSELNHGKSEGTLWSVQMSDREASSVELPTTAVVNEHG